QQLSPSAADTRVVPDQVRCHPEEPGAELVLGGPSLDQADEAFLGNIGREVGVAREVRQIAIEAVVLGLEDRLDIHALQKVKRTPTRGSRGIPGSKRSITPSPHSPSMPRVAAHPVLPA